MKAARALSHAPWLLALCSLVLLSLVAAALHLQQLRTLQRMHQEAALIRSQTLANDTARKITHALSLGIPLQELVGVDALLKNLQQQHTDLVAIHIQDAHEQPLWSGSDTPLNEAIHATSIIAGPEQSTAAIVNTYVLVAPAKLVLVEKLWIWLGLLTLLTTLSFWAARLSFSLRPWLREDVIQKMSSHVHRGIFQTVWLSTHAAAHDTRPEQLSAGVQAVHEAKERLQRLVHSLRQTEPSAHHRQQLDAILEQANQDLTVGAHLHRQRLHAVEQQCFWVSLLLALACISPWIWQLLAAHDRAILWLPAVALFFSAMLVMGRIGRFLRLPVMRVLITGFVSLLFAPFVLPPSSAAVLAHATVCGLLAGWGYAACQSVIYAARRKFIFAQPRLSRPVERAYLYAVACLGPLLAIVTQQALPNEWARMAVLLPAASGLMSCLLWNVSISPWRTRIRHSPAHTPASSSWKAQLFYAAIGMGVGALFSDASMLSAQQSCLLVVGWLTGCLLLPRTPQATQTAMALLLLSLSVWHLFTPSTIIHLCLIFTAAATVASASCRLRAPRPLATMEAAIAVGLGISYALTSGLSLSLSAALLGCSCLLSLKLSRQGARHAN